MLKKFAVAMIVLAWFVSMSYAGVALNQKFDGFTTGPIGTSGKGERERRKHERERMKHRAGINSCKNERKENDDQD